LLNKEISATEDEIDGLDKTPIVNMPIIIVILKVNVFFINETVMKVYRNLVIKLNSVIN
jgi:hypothetical protein